MSGIAHRSVPRALEHVLSQERWNTFCPKSVGKRVPTLFLGTERCATLLPRVCAPATHHLSTRTVREPNCPSGLRAATQPHLSATVQQQWRSGHLTTASYPIDRPLEAPRSTGSTGIIGIIGHSSRLRLFLEVMSISGPSRGHGKRLCTVRHGFECQSQRLHS
jgi:hypothetical protein